MRLKIKTTATLLLVLLLLSLSASAAETPLAKPDDVESRRNVFREFTNSCSATSTRRPYSRVR
jgi:hypothetical protein